MSHVLSLLALLSVTLPGYAQWFPGADHTLHFYGRVNHWADSRSKLRTELNLMEREGVDGYMIELTGWGKQQWSRRWLRRTSRHYRWLVRQCRSRHLLLFVSVVNDNMGHHKYGDSGPLLEEVAGEAEKLMHTIKRRGPRDVLVQPVAETHTSAGERFETLCIKELTGFTLVYNGEYGFPETLPEGYLLRAVHPAHIDVQMPTDAFIVSDHGLIIRELAVDGTLDGPADSTKLTSWIQQADERRVPAIGYYAFQRRDVDPAAIKALGR
ncbi:MAG: hypothetical protein IJR87_02225 [Bacteroidaceae bacterium]|nr:hypothetical protein [Bacteroidaceae bacterium]